jgi:AraC-like DNA-binding protein
VDAEFVKRSGYSATQLCLLFDRVTGLSPCHWLSQERVRRARELLAQSEKSATEIAVEVGFGSRSQFYRTFHKAMRTGPSRYRAIVRHQQ